MTTSTTSTSTSTSHTFSLTQSGFNVIPVRMNAHARIVASLCVLRLTEVNNKTWRLRLISRPGWNVAEIDVPRTRPHTVAQALDRCVQGVWRQNSAIAGALERLAVLAEADFRKREALTAAHAARWAAREPEQAALA